MTLTPQALDPVPTPKDLREALVDMWREVGIRITDVDAAYTTLGNVGHELLVVTSAVPVSLHESPRKGDMVTVKAVGVAITVDTEGSETIDGAASVTVNGVQTYVAVDTGSDVNWVVVDFGRDFTGSLVVTTSDAVPLTLNRLSPGENVAIAISSFVDSLYVGMSANEEFVVGPTANLASEGTFSIDPSTGDTTVGGYLTLTSGFLNLGSPTELTISSGVVTATKSYHSIDTESDAASDDLDTINGGTEGGMLILRAADSARTVVCKDGTGNLQLSGDFSLNNAADRLTLQYDGSNWCELSRSDNGS